MIVTHRIPWNTPHGYTEASIGPTDEPDYESLATQALSMEAAFIGAHPELQPSTRRGEPPAGLREPEYERDQEAERNDAPRPAYQPPQRQQGRGGYGNRPQTDPDAPNCPKHRAPMRRNRRNDGWFCTKHDRDGNYCRETMWDR